jgi:hypothetical protein
MSSVQKWAWGYFVNKRVMSVSLEEVTPLSYFQRLCQANA